jgi:archaetidylinositol phosphate synthase
MCGLSSGGLVDLVYSGLAGFVVRLGLHRVHPNVYTILGLLLALLAPLSAYMGYFALTLLLIVLSSLMDVLDGLVARVSGLQSRWGAFLDSLSDRVSDASYILTLALMGLDWRLCYVLLVLSYLVSYSRARGEGLGVQLKGVGLVERQERVVAVLLIAVVARVDVWVATVALSILTVLTAITVAQRVFSVYTQLKQGVR